MPKRMLIDASHPEETRVVVLDGNKVEEFDFESASRRPLKGNIYLAKVTRVEPSLQAAFVEYGGNRQGFLAFSEIHPDYYQIPVADRMALLEAQTQRLMAEDEDGFETIEIATAPRQHPMLETEAGEDASSGSAEESDTDANGESDAEGARDESDTDESNEPAEQAQGTYPQAEDAERASTESAAAAEENEGGPAREPAVAEGTGGAEEAASPSAEENETLQPAVQAEATGAPQPHQRRGPRQNWPRTPRRKQYKIQEVIKRRQILLVQVVKEERGTKGASLTTFLSLAGRYCVLMPNTPRGGGISRKITQAADRKRLKAAAQSLELPEGMGLIIRTAGANRTKLEIKRDYEYLLRLWDTVRELTLKSNAPALVYEEGSLIKRVIRDLYNKDISEVLVDGEAGYRDAKDFMRMIMPSHAKNVKPYKESLPLFQRFQVEAQLDAMFSPTVTLKSGGYIVINQTEALVAIDVNSGKATREHSIEETAHKTNLEAADEIGRQLRLRDLAGLIVIDFIDMEDGKNDRNVEKRLHNAVKNDRARIQIGKISQFGLMEMSRQRLRAGVVAGSTVTCPHCAGLGIIRSTESAALRLLRALDEEGQRAPGANLSVKAPEDVTIYTLNHKRREIARIEEAYDLQVSFNPQAEMMGGSFELERTGIRVPNLRPKIGTAVSVEAGFYNADAEPELAPVAEDTAEADEAPIDTLAEPPQQRNEAGAQANGDSSDGARRKRRRRRRGRGRNGNGHDGPIEVRNSHGEAPAPERQEPLLQAESAGSGEASDTDSGDIGEAGEIEDDNGQMPAPGSQQAAENADRKRRRRRRGRRGRRRDGEQGMPAPMAADEMPMSGSHPEERDVKPADAFLSELSPQPETAGSDTVMPNAPSSPQWSLTDRASGPVALAHAPEPEALPSASVEPAIQTAKPIRVEVAPEMAEAARGEPQRIAEAEPPRESRKGWWQRRFRI